MNATSAHRKQPCFRHCCSYKTTYDVRVGKSTPADRISTQMVARKRNKIPHIGSSCQQISCHTRNFGAIRTRLFSGWNHLQPKLRFSGAKTTFELFYAGELVAFLMAAASKLQKGGGYDRLLGFLS